jgi:tight adherence protein B
MNPLIITAFVITTLISFVIIIFILRPTKDEKSMSKRLTTLSDKNTELTTAAQPGTLLKGKDDSSFGWMEGAFDTLSMSLSLSQKLRMLILQADSKKSPGSVMIQCLASAAGAALLYFVFLPFPLVTPLVGIAAAFLPIAWLKFKRARRMKVFNNGLAEGIDMMGRSLRAGHSVVSAIGIVAEQGPEHVCTEFAEVFKKQNYGLPMRECLMQMLERVPSQDLRVLVTGILVQKDTGGNLAEILDRIVYVIRERVRIKAEIKTHTAQGRMTGWILCMLPVVMLVLINLIDHGYSDVLFHDPTGQKMLMAGVVLLCLGGLTIRHIIKSIEV